MINLIAAGFTLYLVFNGLLLIVGQGPGLALRFNRRIGRQLSRLCRSFLRGTLRLLGRLLTGTARLFWRGLRAALRRITS